MAGWNALFHKPAVFQPDPAKSEIWNRGAYLVEGLGHCGACHSPRNALGAEKANAYLAGGFAEGWEAPALTSLSQAPIPWSEDELYAYLRTGESRLHGVAAGPMAPVVRELGALPDSDIRAMAVYLGSFNDKAIDKPTQQALAASLEAATATRTSAASSVGARLYQGACAVCHEVGGAPLFGSRPSLALNSNLHSAVPDNLIQPSFLRTWIGAPGHVGCALVRDGRLAGWGVIRPCRKGFKIGPLVADNRGTAEAVLSVLVVRVGGGEIFLDVPGINREAIALAEDFGLAPVFETARMYTGAIPPLRLQRVFGVTSFELG
jgi:mono/diheme cytochrome c family protein